ncbi:hypothetical protein WMQ48_11700 [Vibrio cidicii]|uniref:hypothetical protein n=1 Tax=Vibrio TaxID=662 RepID=UPI000A1767E0|nr:hypothetical protein [Vibrio harveyi]MDF4308270.1 hypothetical protein [Vibrio parahaemolyticus]MDF5070998.1 hypothetical protein [Vibrio parahaemolyticus]MDF5302948.1 hypothetical protein [Vibrio parahaemolyticus]
MLKYKSTIFSDENDIYIALQSNRAKLSTNSLRKLAFKRGILYPSTLDRDELIGQISDLPFSYSQLQELTNKLTPKVNRDQYSVKRISGKFDLTQMNDVVDKVIEARPRFVGAETITHHKSIQSYYIEIDYTEFDFTRGKYQQKKRHGGYIQFLEKDDYISIQFTYTKRIQDILDEVIQMYRDTVNNDILVQNVDLSAVVDADLRNKFMVNLYDTAKPFLFLELEKVRVSKVRSILDSSIDESKPSADLDDDLLDDEEQTEDLLQDADDREYSIDNAQFDGKSLNDADEVNELCNNNFYRSRIKWKSKALSLTDKPIITFELAFDDKYQAKDLKFRILGKEPIEGKGGKEAVNGSDFNVVMRDLEDIIFNTLDEVLTEHGSAEPVPKEVSNA